MKSLDNSKKRVSMQSVAEKVATKCTTPYIKKSVKKKLSYPKLTKNVDQFHETEQKKENSALDDEKQ